MQQSATGSPTTVTEDLARVRAEFSILSSDKKPQDSSWFDVDSSSRCLVRTVVMKTARNSFPALANNYILMYFAKRTPILRLDDSHLIGFRGEENDSSEAMPSVVKVMET